MRLPHFRPVTFLLPLPVKMLLVGMCVAMCCPAVRAPAQHLVIDAGAALPAPPAIKPGYFRNNLTPLGSQYYNADKYWNGSEEEFIELYRHTVLAIKRADPAAQVGGCGMNYWHHGIRQSKINVIGFYPDSLAERTSTLAHLIDTCAAGNLPLDFISWHYFTIYPRWMEYGYEFFRKKLAANGFSRTMQIITEYNAPELYRERKWHAPFLLALVDLVKSWLGLRHGPRACTCCVLTAP